MPQPARWQAIRILTIEVAAEPDKREWRQSTKKVLPMTGDELRREGGLDRVTAGASMQEEAAIQRNEEKREEACVWGLHLPWEIGSRLLGVPGLPGPGSLLRADSAWLGLWPSNP